MKHHIFGSCFPWISIHSLGLISHFVSPDLHLCVWLNTSGIILEQPQLRYRATEQRTRSGVSRLLIPRNYVTIAWKTHIRPIWGFHPHCQISSTSCNYTAPAHVVGAPAMTSVQVLTKLLPWLSSSYNHHVQEMVQNLHRIYLNA